ncbi:MULTISPECIES: photosystem II repair protein Psb32 [Okeania]|uniref:YgcG family protein n=1 Tax=Okeania hirsuta TaxID=1458930 RepID=A0A3N6N3Q1_9CYAN|nr:MULTISPECIES: TPM domain-containing protein [Okeania]NEP03657.1 YgcG family protein [Okeania sp. SIO4D6]NEP42456.1 YgcG family protein [Okeania sp. SIO2H7]NET17260.1 YgcG family protein [Okeania sp. SIO1H6]NEP75949.1 YgcG family protein [Okeania sp. SIO2G5]NEP96561.1 YgcG family protein [Okeania sp. SIO2F5]
MVQLFNKTFNFQNLQTLIVSLLLIIMATILPISSASATGVYQMPSLVAGARTFIVDDAEVFSRITESKLNNTLESLANTTGNEVRFVTIRRLDYGETVDSFTEKLFDKWFPTPETKVNQTLIVLDTLTNNDAIRVGDAVKELMSNDITQSVVDETIQVPIRDGNKYNEAFLAASDRLSAVLSGEPDPGPPEVKDELAAQVLATFKSAEETDDQSATILVVVLLVVATIVPMVTYFWYQGFS